MSNPSDVTVRVATPDDVGGIREVVRSCYGDGFFPEFYDPDQLKKMVYGDDTLVLVAEVVESGLICGSASVLMEVGAFSDLVGEFGRLVVHPAFRHRGVAGKLLNARVESVRERLHVGLMEARVSHAFSLLNARSHGFSPVGFLPAKLYIAGHREHLGLLVRYFGDTLDLRRNHPRLIPEAHPLATASMENIGIRPDVIVDERAAPYPCCPGFEIEELTADGYTSLLRIERGRVEHREVFGPLRLHYGFFKLAANESTYLIARDGNRVEAALGFTWDAFERNVRVFEVIQLGDRGVRALFEALETHCLEQLDAATVEVDVSAYAPRMQRTLVELGYVPCAYVPAMAFHRVERLDVVKMCCLFTSADLPLADLPTLAADIASLVLDSVAQRSIVGEVGTSAEGVELFAELTPEQQARLAACFQYRRWPAGDAVFEKGGPGEQMYIVLEGRMVIDIDGRTVGHVERGECLGEVAMLTESEHSATATVVDPIYAAVLTRTRLRELVRQRPDIGVVLYRNLARSAGRKLRRSGVLFSGRAESDATPQRSG